MIWGTQKNIGNGITNILESKRSRISSEGHLLVFSKLTGCQPLMLNGNYGGGYVEQ